MIIVLAHTSMLCHVSSNHLSHQPLVSLKVTLSFWLMVYNSAGSISGDDEILNHQQFVRLNQVTLSLWSICYWVNQGSKYWTMNSLVHVTSLQCWHFAVNQHLVLVLGCIDLQGCYIILWLSIVSLVSWQWPAGI